MTRPERPVMLAANWKMNRSPAEARAFASRFLPQVAPRPGRTLVFFPPAVTLEAAAAALAGRPDVLVGIQDVYWEPGGAFTGATSVALARAAGARTGLVGHSERRRLFGETDEDTRRKVRALLAGGLTPLLCVGESLAQRDAGATETTVTRQLQAACQGLAAAEVARLAVAYEPVWAIGTGRTARPADAAAVHRALRAALEPLGGGAIPILYGGSVTPDNARSLLAEPAIDGLLVGGASLDPDRWAAVVGEADAGCSAGG